MKQVLMVILAACLTATSCKTNQGDSILPTAQFYLTRYLKHHDSAQIAGAAILVLKIQRCY
jgi:hypothetical protein